MLADEAQKPVSSAVDRTFLINELIILFLAELDTFDLINCQQVCRRWRDIIVQCQELQEYMFFAPTTRVRQKTEPVILNPVFEKHFAQLLSFPHEMYHNNPEKMALQAERCTYAQFEWLPWAEDGNFVDTSARQAYARAGASWRKMLLSQPPIAHLDWWHNWVSHAGEGFGHRDYPEVVRLGMLWDGLEAFLSRGCSVRILLYPTGMAILEDPCTTRAEKRWPYHSESQDQIPQPDMHRIKIKNYLNWDGNSPAIWNEFSARRQEWGNLTPDIPFSPEEQEREKWRDNDGDGYWWRLDACQRDQNGDASSWRWSKSDAFQWIEMRHVHCGSDMMPNDF
ncbi:uncharacterized protein K489DRAFT_385321 [Dissoconium aciculare CBS 342.82]|uniref:F-box domain-containing protein n=1 Tax=Dissoconium aciculare CBS 342.82 TaxID=1314786 RepID=A0A6J3LR05_9PEZI|nr:uncharacterized protein K489DRAFT_385321 [Dissoconium aciculare CBS 342.82]KAF1818053.1 hypothetical protein K489DRAFT_385321 [Dissoconium aciculare CBS 342.82]